jgi:subtilisin family serine protease
VDASAQGITIGVSAPSEQLLGAVPGGGYVQWEGTSGATPIVAGVVALVMASHPGISGANAINRVVSTATDAGAKGIDPIYGYGLINAAAAVRNTVPSVKANPMGDLAAWIHLNRRAEPTATPTTPPTSTSTAVPTHVASGPMNPLGILYPTPTQLRNVGLPIAVLITFGLGALTLIVLSVRQFGRVRRRD